MIGDHRFTVEQDSPLPRLIALETIDYYGQ